MRRFGLPALLALLGAALLGAAPGSAGAMDFASLQALMATHAVTTVDGLLAVLPEALRTHYTLEFHSRSLQDASFANPRAILFGDDASLVLTFNGDPAQRGYDAVETMEFDAASHSFRLREIRFGAPGEPPAISAVNPERCAACHGSPARPIWDTPPRWPGVYGERYHSTLSKREARGIREFLALQPANPRYRALLGARRFGEHDTFVTSSAAAYNGLTTEPPNAQLATLLTELNTRVIAGALRAQPGYDAYRYVLLAAARQDCGPLAEFFPAGMRAALAVQLREYLTGLARIDRHQEAAKAARLIDASTSRTPEDPPLDMGSLRFVVERGLGLSTESWTLAFEHNTYDVAAPPGTWSLGDALYEAVQAGDAKLGELHEFHWFGAGDAYCKRLKEQSRQALDAWYAAAPGTLATASAPAADDTAPALTLCAGCHSGEHRQIVAPQIPFADPQALSVRLQAGSYTHGHLLDEILFRLTDAAGPARMPPGTLLSGEQAGSLATYFSELAGGAIDRPR